MATRWRHDARNVPKRVVFVRGELRAHSPPVCSVFPVSVLFLDHKMEKRIELEKRGRSPDQVRNSV